MFAFTAFLVAVTFTACADVALVGADTTACWDWDTKQNLSAIPISGKAQNVQLDVRGAFGSSREETDEGGKVEGGAWYTLTNFKFDMHLSLLSSMSTIPFRRKNFSLYLLFQGFDKFGNTTECSYPLKQGGTIVTFQKDVFYNKEPFVDDNIAEEMLLCENETFDKTNLSAYPCLEGTERGVSMHRNIREKFTSSGDCNAFYPQKFAAQVLEDKSERFPGNYQQTRSIFMEYFDTVPLESYVTLYRCYDKTSDGGTCTTNDTPSKTDLVDNESCEVVQSGKVSFETTLGEFGRARQFFDTVDDEDVRFFTYTFEDTETDSIKHLRIFGNQRVDLPGVVTTVDINQVVRGLTQCMQCSEHIWYREYVAAVIAEVGDRTYISLGDDDQADYCAKTVVNCVDDFEGVINRPPCYFGRAPCNGEISESCEEDDDGIVRAFLNDTGRGAGQTTFCTCALGDCKEYCLRNEPAWGPDNKWFGLDTINSTSDCPAASSGRRMQADSSSGGDGQLVQRYVFPGYVPAQLLTSQLEKATGIKNERCIFVNFTEITTDPCPMPKVVNVQDGETADLSNVMYEEVAAGEVTTNARYICAKYWSNISILASVDDWVTQDDALPLVEDVDATNCNFTRSEAFSSIDAQSGDLNFRNGVWVANNATGCPQVMQVCVQTGDAYGFTVRTRRTSVKMQKYKYLALGLKDTDLDILRHPFILQPLVFPIASSDGSIKKVMECDGKELDAPTSAICDNVQYHSSSGGFADQFQPFRSSPILSELLSASTYETQDVFSQKAQIQRRYDTLRHYLSDGENIVYNKIKEYTDYATYENVLRLKENASDCFVVDVSDCIAKMQTLVDGLSDLPTGVTKASLRTNTNNFTDLCVPGAMQMSRYSKRTNVPYDFQDWMKTTYTDLGGEILSQDTPGFLPSEECCDGTDVLGPLTNKYHVCPFAPAYDVNKDYRVGRMYLERSMKRSGIVAGKQHLLVVFINGDCGNINPKDFTLGESVVSVSWGGNEYNIDSDCGSNKCYQTNVHDLHADEFLDGDEWMFEVVQVSQLMCALVGTFPVPLNTVPKTKCYSEAVVERNISCPEHMDFTTLNYSSFSDTKFYDECWEEPPNCHGAVDVYIKMTDAYAEKFEQDNLYCEYASTPNAFKGLYDMAQWFPHYHELCTYENGLKDLLNHTGSLTCDDAFDIFSTASGLKNPSICDTNTYESSIADMIECLEGYHLLVDDSNTTSTVTGNTSCVWEKKLFESAHRYLMFTQPSLIALRSHYSTMRSQNDDNDDETCMDFISEFVAGDNTNLADCELVPLVFGLPVNEPELQLLNFLSTGLKSTPRKQKIDQRDEGEKASGIFYGVRSDTQYVVKRSSCNCPAAGSCDCRFQFNRENQIFKQSHYPMKGDEYCIEWDPLPPNAFFQPGIKERSKIQLLNREVFIGLNASKFLLTMRVQTFDMIPVFGVASIYVMAVPPSFNVAQFILNPLTREALKKICISKVSRSKEVSLEYNQPNDKEPTNFAQYSKECYKLEGASLGEWAAGATPKLTIKFFVFSCQGVCDGDYFRSAGSLLRTCEVTLEVVHQIQLAPPGGVTVDFSNSSAQEMRFTPVVSADLFLSSPVEAETGDVVVDFTKQFVFRPCMKVLSSFNEADSTIACDSGQPLLLLSRNPTQLIIFEFVGVKPELLNNMSISSSKLNFYVDSVASSISMPTVCADGDPSVVICGVSGIIEDLRDERDYAFGAFVARVNFSNMPSSNFSLLEEKCTNEFCTVQIILDVTKADRRRLVAGSGTNRRRRLLASTQKVFFLPAQIPSIRIQLTFKRGAVACETPRDTLLRSIVRLVEDELSCDSCTKTADVGDHGTSDCVAVDLVVRSSAGASAVKARLSRVEWASDTSHWTLLVSDAAIDLSSEQEEEERTFLKESRNDNEASTAQWIALGTAAAMGVAILGSARYFSRRRASFKVASDQSWDEKKSRYD